MRVFWAIRTRRPDQRAKDLTESSDQDQDPSRHLIAFFYVWVHYADYHSIVAIPFFTVGSIYNAVGGYCGAVAGCTMTRVKVWLAEFLTTRKLCVTWET